MIRLLRLELDCQLYTCWSLWTSFIYWLQRPTKANVGFESLFQIASQWKSSITRDYNLVSKSSYSRTFFIWNKTFVCTSYLCTFFNSNNTIQYFYILNYFSYIKYLNGKFRNWKNIWLAYSSWKKNYWQRRERISYYSKSQLNSIISRGYNLDKMSFCVQFCPLCKYM